jgi:hypothetical protein
MQHEQAPTSATHPEARAAATARGHGDELPLVYCPDCGMPAWVEWRDAAGRDGAAYVKVRCFARHWFLMLEEPPGG